MTSSRISPALWLLLLVVLPAFTQTTEVRKPVLIVLDDWWNFDYVKSSCQMYAQFGTPCTRKPEETVQEFESDLQVAFATESACHGLVLRQLTPGMAQAALKNPAAPATGPMLDIAQPHWQLMLDLDGRSVNQVGRGWTISNETAQTDFNGKIATPARLAKQICKIVRGVGGTTK